MTRTRGSASEISRRISGVESRLPSSTKTISKSAFATPAMTLLTRACVSRITRSSLRHGTTMETRSVISERPRARTEQSGEESQEHERPDREQPAPERPLGSEKCEEDEHRKENQNITRRAHDGGSAGDEQQVQRHPDRVRRTQPDPAPHRTHERQHHEHQLLCPAQLRPLARERNGVD